MDSYLTIHLSVEDASVLLEMFGPAPTTEANDQSETFLQQLAAFVENNQ